MKSCDVQLGDGIENSKKNKTTTIGLISED